MIIPIIKLTPEKRPRFLLRPVFFTGNGISVTSDSSFTLGEEPDKKVSVSTGFP